MYLVSQMWWLLLLAFLLGALLGYVMWRACGRRRLQASYERDHKDLQARLTALEHERDRFSAAALDAERESIGLKEALKGTTQNPRPLKPGSPRELQR